MSYSINLTQEPSPDKVNLNLTLKRLNVSGRVLSVVRITTRLRFPCLKIKTSKCVCTNDSGNKATGQLPALLSIMYHSSLSFSNNSAGYFFG